MMKVLYIFLLMSIVACGYGDYTIIRIYNHSKRHIDSAVIYIQAVKRIVRHIKPGDRIALQIERLIDTNHHDVTVRGQFFDNKKSDFKGGLFYTDLGGNIENEYLFTIKRDLFISVEPIRQY